MSVHGRKRSARLAGQVLRTRPGTRLWAASLAIAALAGGCGGGGSTTATETMETRPSPADAAIARSFDTYLRALNKHKGITVCESLAVSAFSKLHPPAKRESCAEAVEVSIGH